MLRIPFALWVVTGTKFVLSKWGPLSGGSSSSSQDLATGRLSTLNKITRAIFKCLPPAIHFHLFAPQAGQLRGNELLWWSWRLPPGQGWKQSRRCCGWIFPVCAHDFSPSMLPRRGFLDLWPCTVITEEENKKYLLNTFFFSNFKFISTCAKKGGITASIPRSSTTAVKDAYL